MAHKKICFTFKKSTKKVKKKYTFLKKINKKHQKMQKNVKSKKCTFF